MSNQTLNFQNPSRYTKWLIFFLQGCLVFTTIRLFYDYSAWTLFTKVVNGVYTDVSVIEELREFSDNRRAFVEHLYLWVLLGTGLSFAFWMYQANQNCRALGAKGMRFTPAWCIGWFFVPLWSMWKPYQALKEIWNACYDSKYWSNVRSPSVIKFWWACYLISSLFHGLLQLQLFMPTESYTVLITIAKIAMIRDILTYPLCISAIMMVNEIYGRQIFSIELKNIYSS